MSTFRARYSSHTGNSYHQGLLTPAYGSPYASPRQSYARSPRKGKNIEDKAILTVQGVLLVLFILAIWKGVSYSTGAASQGSSNAYCPDCNAQEDDRPVSDLSIKLATSKPTLKSRKDFYAYDDSIRDNSHSDGPSQSPSSAQTSLQYAAQHLQNRHVSLTGQPIKGAMADHRVITQQQYPQPNQQPQPTTQHTGQTQPQAQDSSADRELISSQQTQAPAGAASRVENHFGNGMVAGRADTSVSADVLSNSREHATREAEQLAALSKIIQQQQDTISRQSKALLDLQSRFAQQEHQLQAVTAAAAAEDSTQQEEVESYLPPERVSQELDMLHNVEAQIEALSAGVTVASQALPQLTEQQKASQLADLARAEQYMSRLSRVAAAISLRTSDPLTEGAHDPITELRHYYAGIASQNVTLDWQDALSRQSRPTAESLGIVHVEPYADEEADLETLDLRMEYAQAVLSQMHEEAPCSLALVTTWSGDLWGLRRELLPWLTYHALQGVSKIYVMYDGSDKNTLTSLHDLAPYVSVILSSPPLASTEDVAAFDAWLRSVPDSHIRDWSSQPGSYRLMTKQGFAVTKALELALADHMTWLIHIDPDELLHPGAAPSAGNAAAAFSLLPELCSAPNHVPSIRFVNVEGVPEAADIENRYEQVTLFRAHRHLVPPAAQPFRYIFKQGHAESWLHLYTNGKSAVRPDAPGVVQGGAHVFLGPADPRWVTPDNPHGIWRPIVSNSTLLLHYAYATPGDVAVKAGRSCPEKVVEAALTGDTAAVSKCFALDIDQRAFIAAVKDRKAAGLPLPSPPAASYNYNPAEERATAAGFSTGRTLLVDDATLAGIKTSNGFSNVSWPVGREVQDFFWGELALSEGAPFECLTADGKAKGWCSMSDVSKLKSLLIRTGLMMRLHAPAQAMKGIEAAVRQLMMISGRTAHPVHPTAAQAAALAAKEAATQGADSAGSVVGTGATEGQQQQQPGVHWTPEAAVVADASPVNQAATPEQLTAGDTVPAATVSIQAGGDAATATIADVAAAIPTTAAAAMGSAADGAATSDIQAHNDNVLLSSPTERHHDQHLVSASTTTSTASSSNRHTSSTVEPTAAVAMDDEANLEADGVSGAESSMQQAHQHKDHPSRGHHSPLREKLLV